MLSNFIPTESLKVGILIIQKKIFNLKVDVALDAGRLIFLQDCFIQFIHFSNKAINQNFSIYFMID